MKKNIKKWQSNFKENGNNLPLKKRNSIILIMHIFLTKLINFILRGEIGELSKINLLSIIREGLGRRNNMLYMITLKFMSKYLY